ncbi:MAG TPA: methyltransferase domain-containing protein [Dongiaceae bacterium]|nr:methyltransferase domain-containing protein [Dongiaceae bacterium]
MAVETDRQFAGSIPALYDRFMGPMLFQPYAEDLAARATALSPHRVLEVAAGTGIVTRALAAALPGAAITATDLNQAMLDYAATVLNAPHVTFRQADGQKLPFEAGSFDLVACQFGIMFFPDRVAGFREARRVLAPGGRYLFSVWADLGANDFVEVITEELEARFPEDPPRFMMRTPHGHHNIAHLSRDLATAGFGDVKVESLDKVSRSPSARDVAIGYCQGTPLSAEIAARGDLAAVTEALAEVLAERFGRGPVEGRIRAHVFSAGA